MEILSDLSFPHADALCVNCNSRSRAWWRSLSEKNQQYQHTQQSEILISTADIF